VTSLPELWGRIRRLVMSVARGTQAFLGQSRVAVIGCGESAVGHMESFEHTGISQVWAVCDVRLGALAEALDRWPWVRGYRDYRQMLREVHPDIVSICTDTASRAEIAIHTADAGVCGILCEEPLALQMGSIERMVSHCHRGHVRLAGNLPLRFNPNFVRAQRVIRSGMLGSIQGVKGCASGTLMEQGPFLMDAVRFLLGNPAPRSVTGRCERVSRGGRSTAIAEENTFGEIAFDSGIRFVFVTGSLASSSFSITIEAGEGVLEVGPDHLSVDPEIEVDDLWVDPDYRVIQFREFVQWVKGKRSEYAADHLQSALAVEMVLGVYESARLGVPVELPLQNKSDIVHELYPDSCPARSAMASRRSVWTIDRRRDRLASEGGIRSMDTWFSQDLRIGLSEMANLVRVVRRKRPSASDRVEVCAFEDEFRNFLECPHVVACMSGTSAFHCALGALNVNPCDEIITTPLAEIDVVLAILWSNCIPIFADVDAQTGNVTAQSIARKITPKTRAAIVTHFLGRPADIDSICSLLRERRIAVIEDCSQALGARYRGKPVGTFGDLGCFSFGASSPMTRGEGGVLVARLRDRAERAALFADKGGDGEGGPRHVFLGMNCRMTELQAAVLRSQLRRLPERVERRHRTAIQLARRLRSIPGMILPTGLLDHKPLWWMLNFRVDETILGVSTDEFCESLLVEGVRAVRHYVPGPVFHAEMLNTQSTYGTSRYPFSATAWKAPNLDDYPGFLEFHRRQLYLPWSDRVRGWHIEAIAGAVRKVANHYRRAAQEEMVSSETGTVLSRDDYAEAMR